MSYFILCLFLLGGAIIVAWGLYGWIKKDPGFFQGKRRFEVKIDKYLRYMSILVVVFGLCIALTGLLNFCVNLPIWCAWIFISIFLTLGAYGEKRYKVK